MRPANIAISMLLILAGMVWLSLIAIAPDMHAADPVGLSFTCALAKAGLVALWALLAAAVLIAGVTSRAELSSGIFVGLLLLGTVAASLATVRVCAGMFAPAWMLVVVFAPPPIVACLSIVIQSARLQRSAPPLLMNGLWCALIALALLPCPFIVREARLQSEQPARLERSLVAETPAAPHAQPRESAGTMLLAAEHTLARH